MDFNMGKIGISLVFNSKQFDDSVIFDVKCLYLWLLKYNLAQCPWFAYAKNQGPIYKPVSFMLLIARLNSFWVIVWAAFQSKLLSSGYLKAL